MKHDNDIINFSKTAHLVSSYHDKPQMEKKHHTGIKIPNTISFKKVLLHLLLISLNDANKPATFINQSHYAINP